MGHKKEVEILSDLFKDELSALRLDISKISEVRTSSLYESGYVNSRERGGRVMYLALALKCFSDDEFDRNFDKIKSAINKIKTNGVVKCPLEYFFLDIATARDFPTSYTPIRQELFDSYLQFNVSPGFMDDAVVLSRMLKLGLDVNYCISVDDEKIFSKSPEIRYGRLGIPLYLMVSRKVLFEWCLNNGADLGLVINSNTPANIAFMDKKIKTNHSRNHWYYMATKKDFIKNHGKTPFEYVKRQKQKFMIDAINKFQGGNTSQKTISSFKDIVDALIEDNRDVLSNLTNYSELIVKESIRGKDLLCYAIDKNRFEWFKSLIENKMVDFDRLTSANQSHLHYAINKTRPYMIKYLVDNKIYNKKDLNDGTDLFIDAIYKYPKLAAKLIVWDLFPIKTMADKKSWQQDIYRRFLSDNVKLIELETSKKEKHLINLDLEELGIAVSAANKNKLKI